MSSRDATEPLARGVAFHFLDGAKLWNIKATHGLPLDMALAAMAGQNCLPTWESLFRAALADGANLEKLARELMFFCREVYAPQVAQVLVEKLQLMPAYIHRHPEKQTEGLPGPQQNPTRV